MPIWITHPVDVQPNITLVRWRIFQRENGRSHFVGYHPAGHEGRVSSAIQQFDPVTRRGVTQSGRVYELSGCPGFDSDAMYIWELWSRANGWESCTDVTSDVATELMALRQPDGVASEQQACSRSGVSQSKSIQSC